MLARPERATRFSLALLLLTCAVVGAARFVVLSEGGAPPTTDGGNWIAFGDSLLGRGYRPSSLAYPPLVPIVTTLATDALGARTGVSLVGAVASALPAVGLYAALRQSGLAATSVLPALLLLGASSVGEATAWGGFPQLVGLALVPVSLVSLEPAAEGRSRSWMVAFGLSTFGVLAASHFVAAALFFVLVFRLLLLGFEAWNRTRDAMDHLMRLSLATLPLVVLLVPTYVTLAEPFFVSRNEYSALDNLRMSSFVPRLNDVLGAFAWLWRVLIPLGLLTPLILGVRGTALRRNGACLAAGVLAVLLLTRETRYLYLLPLVAAFVLGAWLEVLSATYERTLPSLLRYRLPEIVFVSLLAVAVLQAQTSHQRFSEQRDFYGVLTVGLVQATSAVDERAGTNDVVAIPSLADAPVGWWIEALSERRVIYGSPLRWLNFPDEVDRASRANSLFAPDFPNSRSLDLIEEHALDWLIIPKNWAWYQPDEIDAWIEENRFAVVEDNRHALAVRVSPPVLRSRAVPSSDG